jgi:class 3 adenylate cyclase
VSSRTSSPSPLPPSATDRRSASSRVWRSRLTLTAFVLTTAHFILVFFGAIFPSPELTAVGGVFGTLALPVLTWLFARWADRTLPKGTADRPFSPALARVFLGGALFSLIPGLFGALYDAPLEIIVWVVELSTLVVATAAAVGLVLMALGLADLLYAVTRSFKYLSTRLMVLLLFATFGTFLWLTALSLSLRGLTTWGLKHGHLDEFVMSFDELTRWASAVLGGAGLAISLELPFALLFAWRFGRNATEGLAHLRAGFDRVANGDLETEVAVEGNDEVGEMQRGFNAMLFAARERRFLENAFSRYVSPVVLERLKHSKSPGDADRREATVLFSDIRGFTALSADLDPEEVMKLLNAYMARMVDVIARYDGYIDKFIGDAIMVIFGAPLDQPDHALRALRCARAMQDELAKANAEGVFGREIQMGVGLNTGPLVAGNLGNERQVEFTVIGDTVNVASRACGEAKAGKIAAPEAVYLSAEAVLDGEIPRESLGPVELKGKGPTELFALEADLAVLQHP